jgi:hypothetical protein
MKQTILTGVLAMAIMSAQAQDFKTVLTKTFTIFDTSRDQNVQIEQSNKLTLIAKKWDNEWASHYYVSLSKTILSYREKDAGKKDAYLDEAEKEKADAVSILKKENDETYVLSAMIANARMGVDPMNRWQKYGKIFSDNLQSAKELNPDNPRMYYLQAVSKLFTPKAYGGGKKIALPYFEKADALYAKEKDDDITKPYWGKEQNTRFLAECKKEDKE